MYKFEKKSQEIKHGVDSPSPPLLGIFFTIAPKKFKETCIKKHTNQL